MFDWSVDGWTPIYPFYQGMKANLIKIGGSVKNRLGGKGAGLYEMSVMDLPVPPGFVIDTDTFKRFQQTGANTIKYLTFRVMTAYKELADRVGYAPLVSVRSGAPVSMPGMMDTISNVGITEASLPFWASRLGPVVALDCYRRFLAEYGKIVSKIPEKAIQAAHHGCDLATPHGQTNAVNRLRALYPEHTDGLVSDDAIDQIMNAVQAVFQSWDNERAVAYRNHHGIPYDLGTAVTIQTMVFGNAGHDSGSGVLFTRDLATGQDEMRGEWKANVQGEDVVSGKVTPDRLIDMPTPLIEQLQKIGAQLEKEYRDAQDIEFTVEKGKLWILQTRTAKRTAEAAFRIAVDMELEKLITKEVAFSRVTPAMYRAVIKPKIDPAFSIEPHGIGIAASPGFARGLAVKESKTAMGSSLPVILIRPETDPDDFQGMIAAAGILTAKGGLTSHASVTARSLNKPAVTALKELNGDPNWLTNLQPGQMITIDGSTGRVWVDVEVPIVEGGEDPYVKEMVRWGYEKLKVVPSSPVILGGPQRIPFWAWVSDPKLAKESLAKLRKMKADKRSQVVIDIPHPSELRHAADQLLWEICGQPMGDLSDAVQPMLALLRDKPIANLTLMFGKNYSPATIESFTQLGYRVGGVVASLKALLTMTGPSILDPAFVQKTGQWETDKILSLMGNKFEAMPMGLTEVEVVQKVFGV